MNFQKLLENRRNLAQNRQFSKFFKKIFYHPQVPSETHQMWNKKILVPATIWPAGPKFVLLLYWGLKMGSYPYLPPGGAGAENFLAIN